jgi:hypothetical protein
LAEEKKALDARPEYKAMGPRWIVTFGGGEISGGNMQRYLHTVNGDAAFDPETVRALGVALDDAWRSLQRTGVYFTSRGHAEATRERLARHIIEQAKCGERDLDRLREDALHSLEQSNISSLKPRYSGL